MTQKTGQSTPAAKKAAKKTASKAADESTTATATAATKATAKKATAKKAPAKKAAAKKTGAKKAVTKKTAAKKTAAKKAATKKTTAKKAAAKKTAAKKTAAKKTAAKKATAKKTVAKKAAKKAAKKTTRKAVPSGRKPGRPPKHPPMFDDLEDSGEDIPELKPLPSRRGGKRGKAERETPSRKQLSPEEQEARRNRLKVLIRMGKERGYLTFGEINDQLSDDLTDAEAIDGIISTFSDMGISVYDQAPDADALLMSDNAAMASSDDDVDDEADAALTTVDSDFGRTTDPVRMYMREMGSVELLTREGEIEIAKRIEDGLKHMVMAIADCHTTVNEILQHTHSVCKGEARSNEVVDGLVDEDGEDYAGSGVPLEGEDTDGPAGAMTTRQIKHLRDIALKKFDIVSEQFEKMRVAFESE